MKIEIITDIMEGKRQFYFRILYSAIALSLHGSEGVSGVNMLPQQ